MVKDASRSAPPIRSEPPAAVGMELPVRPKLSEPEQWTRRLMVRLDSLSMSRGLLLGVGIAGVSGYGLLRAGPQWGLGGAVLLLGIACTLALAGDAVAEPQPEPDPASSPEPKSAAEAAPSPPASAKPKPLPEPLEMIELPGGEFWMGSPDSEANRRKDEIRHRVKIPAFAIGKYTVTQLLYEDLMGDNPIRFRGDTFPAECLSWFDAVKFCNKLSERVGLQPCYRIAEQKQDGDLLTDGDESSAELEVTWDRTADGYRLPTEAEWEYACRAGTETAYSFGDDPAHLGEYAWFGGNSEMKTHEVGRMKPNGWGLFDLPGNVWEWCWDWYSDYRETHVSDPSVMVSSPIGPSSGPGRALRGGSVLLEPRVLRSAYRNWGVPTVRYDNVGFRCVRSSVSRR